MVKSKYSKSWNLGWQIGYWLQICKKFAIFFSAHRIRFLIQDRDKSYARTDVSSITENLLPWESTSSVPWRPTFHVQSYQWTCWHPCGKTIARCCAVGSFWGFFWIWLRAPYLHWQNTTTCTQNNCQSVHESFFLNYHSRETRTHSFTSTYTCLDFEHSDLYSCTHRTRQFLTTTSIHLPCQNADLPYQKNPPTTISIFSKPACWSPLCTVGRNTVQSVHRPLEQLRHRQVIPAWRTQGQSEQLKNVPALLLFFPVLTGRVLVFSYDEEMFCE